MGLGYHTVMRTKINTAVLLLSCCLIGCSNQSVAYTYGECSINNLVPYSITFTFNENKYIGIIYLPNNNHIKTEFCGFWNQAKLTEGKNQEFYGYNGESSYIYLDPGMNDAGFMININISNEWPQEGHLNANSYTGYSKIGAYSIEAM